MNKKMYFISSIVISIIVITICSILIIQKNKEKLDYQIEVVNEIDYMVFSENNKFGVINRNGQIIVDSKYDIIQIPNPSKPVFICMYNYNEEKGQYNIKVLNDKQEQILYQYVYVEAIQLNSEISSIPYEKSVLKYISNEKYGLIDFEGNIITKPIYDEIQGLDYNEGLLLVKKKGKYGVININGAVIVKEKYDKIYSDGYYEDGSEYKKSGFIVGKKIDGDCKYGYIDCRGKQILEEKFEQIERIPNINKNEDIYLVAFEEGKACLYNNKKKIINNDYEDIGYDKSNNCLILQKASKQGIADLNGNIIIEIKYDNIYVSGKYINLQYGNNIEIFDFITKKKINIENIVGLNQISNEKYAIAITREEKYTILDINKNKLKDNEYDYLEYMYDNYYIALNGQEFGIVDLDGNVIVDFKYDYIQKLSDTKMVQAIYMDENIIDLIVKDKLILSMKNSEVYIENGYINVRSDLDFTYLDFDGNILESDKIFNSMLYAHKQDSKWGFVNKSGEIVVKAQYDFVTEFNEYGFAGVKKDGKWGVININGDVIMEPTYYIDSNNPKFVGKYYEYRSGYSEPCYICDKNFSE